MIARETSLEKFSPTTSDHRLAEPHLGILAAPRERSHPEAVNLVVLLSFFAHTIPVPLTRLRIARLAGVWCRDPLGRRDWEYEEKSGQYDRGAHPTWIGGANIVRELCGFAKHLLLPRSNQVKSRSTRATVAEGRLQRSGSYDCRPCPQFQPTQSLPSDSSDVSRRHSRQPSSSPRLIQTALNNQAATRTVPVVPLDDNNPLDYTYHSKSVPAQDGHLSTRPVQSSYNSQPMWRDPCRESHKSLASAPPAVPGSASLGTSLQIREPYLYSRPCLASIAVVAANLWGEALRELLSSPALLRWDQARGISSRGSKRGWTVAFSLSTCLRWSLITHELESHWLVSGVSFG